MLCMIWECYGNKRVFLHTLWGSTTNGQVSNLLIAVFSPSEIAVINIEACFKRVNMSTREIP